jgi:hypothetical protein
MGASLISCLAGHLLRKVRERVQNAVGAWIDGDRRAVAPEDHPLAVEDEKRSLAHALALAIGAIRFRDLAFRMEVGKQREVDVAVFRKGLVAPSRIDRDADELGVLGRNSGRIWLYKAI